MDAIQEAEYEEEKERLFTTWAASIRTLFLQSACLCRPVEKPHLRWTRSTGPNGRFNMDNIVTTSSQPMSVS